MKLLISIFIFITSLYSQTTSPTSFIKSSGNVMELVLYKDSLIVGTDAGTMEVYNLDNHELLLKAEFTMIKDFMGDDINPKVFSVDYIKSSDTYLAIVQASNGARELYTINNGKKTEVIDSKAKLFISKAKFIDNNRVMLALLSNEFILYDIVQKKEIYRLHVSYSHFSDFMLSEDKTLMASGDESGEITITNVEKGEIYKTLKGANLDNLYKVDMKAGKVLGAGQDRRGSVYDIDTGTYSRFDGDFLIYAGALSPSGKKAAFAFTENNDIVVFDLFLNEKVYTLSGQKSTLNTIIFKNEKELISGSDDNFIMIWRLDK